jgi:alpha-ketoglutarate-dependent taurine dioxygenase
MENKPSASSLFRTRPRKTVKVSQESLVETRPLVDGEPFVLELRPGRDGVDLGSWAASQADLLQSRLLEHGALLFRGFGIGSVERFREVAKVLCPDLLDYKERAAPRHEIGSQIYTSTEFPADQHIPLHHEMSYSHNWPTKILFYCDQPAAAGGRTPLTDDRKVIHLLDPEVKRRFIDRGVMYVRNYGEGVDLPWQEVFQTEDRAQVERYCREAHMEVDWRSGDRLRTRAARQVLAIHPVTGDTVWFNHAHLFHMSNLEPAVRDALLAEFEPDELPRNAFHADGSPISEADLDHIRQVYQDTAVRFPWEQGDVLLVDNFLVSHGREPYEGPRRILVAMAELYTNPELGGEGSGAVTS